MPVVSNVGDRSPKEDTELFIYLFDSNFHFFSFQVEHKRPTIWCLCKTILLYEHNNVINSYINLTDATDDQTTYLTPVQRRIV